MKRERDLYEVVDEMVEAANERDEEGRLVLPMMANPFIVALLHTRNAFLELLEKRPIAFLNLIQTNKEVTSFFDEFPTIWQKMIDYIMANEVNAYYGDVYPFFLVQKNRWFESQPDRAVWEGDGLSRFGLFNHIWPSNSPGWLGKYSIDAEMMRKPLYLVYHDDLTRRYMDILIRLEQVSGFLLLVLDPGRNMRNYVGEQGRIYADPDYLIVDESQPKIRYNVASICDDLSAILKKLKSIEPLVVNDDDERLHELTTKFVTQRQFDEFMELDRRATSLRNWLRDPFEQLDVPTQEELQKVQAKPVQLNRDTAQPYRGLLYGSVNGYFKTTEEQKALLICVLRRLEGDKEEKIMKYGKNYASLPFKCAWCKVSTFQVDQIANLAYCNDNCRHLHTSNNQ